MLSISPPARRFVLANFLMTAGNGAFLTCSAIYFTRVAGLSPTEFGLGLTIASAVGLFAGVPLGHLADRRGPRNATAALVALNGLAATSYLAVRSFPVFVLAACAFVVFQRGAAAARQALMAGILDGEARVRTQAIVRSVNNIGIAVGAALAGIALQIGTPTAFSVVLIADALSFLASAAVFFSMPAVSPGPAKSAAGSKRSVFRDGPFVAYTAVSTVLSLHLVLLEVVVPLWIITYTDASAAMVTVLFLINTITVVLFQVRISGRAQTMSRAVVASRVSGIVWLVACALFAFSAHGPLVVQVIVLVVAGLVHVWGEMLFSAASWTISFGMAPDGKHGQYQGFYFTGYGATAMIAPTALTFLLVTWGPPGWLVLGALSLLACLLVGPVVAWAERTRPKEDQTACLADEPI